MLVSRSRVTLGLYMAVHVIVREAHYLVDNYFIERNLVERRCNLNLFSKFCYFQYAVILLIIE